MPQPMNVKENWLLYDTVGIFNATVDPAASAIQQPAGWFKTYAEMGSANELNFFNVRNRSIGKPYNNQDSIDKMSYGFRASDLGVGFFANSFTQSPSPPATTFGYSPEDQMGHIFCADLPRHTSVIVRVQQDDILKCHAFWLGAGYGPFGDGYGRGSPSTNAYSHNPSGYDHHLGVITQNMPQLSSRWQFPLPIEIPRTATLNVKIKFSEYGRQLLLAMRNLNLYFGDDSEFDIAPTIVFAGIQVSFGGERLVQRRAGYHA